MSDDPGVTTASKVLKARLSPDIQALIGKDLRKELGEPKPLPVGDELFELVRTTGFLRRFWQAFGGVPSQWGGFPTGEELDLPLNHYDKRIVWANCSFDPHGENQKVDVSCAFVASVLSKNLGNRKMWDLLLVCLDGRDFTLVMALIHHRFQKHCS